MSHTVDPLDLASAAAPYGETPFLLYSSTDGAARVNHVVAHVELGETTVRVSGFGRGIVARVEAGARLSLLWPARDAESFSLIADGFGRLEDDSATLTIDIDAAVLHRPAPIDGQNRC